jgi:hypothetical protein
VSTLVAFCPPAFRHVPDRAGTLGPEYGDLAASVGLQLDPEQQLAVDDMTAYDDRGRTVAQEFGLCAPRQNIKTHVAKAGALGDLVLLEQHDCLWTAHRRDTAYEAFRNDAGTGLADLFDSYDHLRRLVDEIKDSDGETVIRLRPRAAGLPSPSLEFVTRSERGSRGLTGRRVTFDEALFLKPSMTSAMLPVLSAQSVAGSVQVRYLGSAGLKDSAVWRALRDRGRAGTGRRLAWLEWCAPHEECEQDACGHAVDTPGCALDRPHLVRAANLAADRRIDVEGYVLTTERQGMTPADFACERLGWWQDPPAADGEVLPGWRELVDADAQPQRPLVLGADVSIDRTASIAAAWRRADGRAQVMLGVDDDGRLDVALSPRRALERLTAMAGRWGATVVLGGPAADLEADLQAAGVHVTVLSSAQWPAACARLDDAVRDAQLRHGNQPALNTAVGALVWGPENASGARGFRLRDAPGAGPGFALVRSLAGLDDAPTEPRVRWL